MNLSDITLDSLSANQNIRSVDFDGERWFSVEDLNNMFMGAFRNIHIIALPLQARNGNREYSKMISFSDISARVLEMSNRSEFDQKLFTALNYNPKKR